MFIFTVPAEPPQAPPALIAQVSGQSAPPIRAIKTITFCRDKTSGFPDSAFNSYSPISAEFLQQIGKSYTGTIDEVRQYKVTLLDQPKHGQAQLVYEPSQHWTYVPEKAYVGADRVIYLVGTQGVQYKVVINFWVIPVIDENSDVQQCDSIKFGTQNGADTNVSYLWGQARLITPVHDAPVVADVQATTATVMNLLAVDVARPAMSFKQQLVK